MDRVSRELTMRLVVVALIPAAAAIAFGLVQFGRLGLTLEHWANTYAMVGGGLAAAICLVIYARALSPDAPTGGLHRVVLTVAWLGVFLFALYLLGVAGAFRLFLLVGKGFTPMRLIAGTAWVVMGYTLLQRLWVMSQLVAEVREGRMVISDDSSSMGVSEGGS